ncbi:twin-arginine translocase TatA/TatE family subunit [Mobilicoccus caccae]|uniref:Sec-independent protein translocase protein TatB n=1 Tax=Mobilicoccus caccae TaxID=1859295 RepID=A0ABQ6INT5_9MICO|nr:twin-arginine translocase TatA/TatE family subunit [Mobilicoccus caccae]GMA38852.1 hypothetical protein GCM10025883_08970 [Mobilicoccus caccae]
MGAGEFGVILVLAFLLIGPERLPEVLAKVKHFVREARKMAEGAKGQLREQMGPEFDDIDWKSYDPRQYDPRRIVREALAEPLEDDDEPARDEPQDRPTYRPAAVYDPARPVPFDTDAT